MTMTFSQKYCTKSGYVKEATPSMKQFNGLLNISGREALSNLKDKLIKEELKKSKIIDRDVDIAKRLIAKHFLVFGKKVETLRRRISLVRSEQGRTAKANTENKRLVVAAAKKIIKQNPNNHNCSHLAELLMQEQSNYSFSYLYGLILDLKKFGKAR